ncbi:GNAT family N-acetyltransferase [Caenispirillum salinarum]|uniref:GNAT family N-acetyltransferase n=1 Tax=Caenispirillum salinarum TaxID=859058 RepID=UPI00384EA72E
MADRDPYNPEQVSPDMSAGNAAGSVLVREATDADLRAAEAIDGPGSHVPEPGSSWIVAEEAGTGRVLGYATPEPKHIGVDPDMRGRGVGEILEEHLGRRFG